jgi:hypothetical protein
MATPIWLRPGLGSPVSGRFLTRFGRDAEGNAAVLGVLDPGYTLFTTEFPNTFHKKRSHHTHNKREEREFGLAEISHRVHEDLQSVARRFRLAPRPARMLCLFDVPLRMRHQSQHAARCVAHAGDVGL